MKAIKNFLNQANDAFDNVHKVPFLIWCLIVATVFVLPVPFSYITITSDLLTTNEIFASVIIKSLPIISNILLWLHIVAATFSILTGPFLFISIFRNAKPLWHRKMGQAYVLGCIISAITVIPLAWYNNPGTVAKYGFTPMAILWFFTTYFAYTAAINKNYVTHRRWAMRSYAMTFAFVHVNLTYKYFLPYHLLTLDGAKAMQSMVSWQINLFFVEFYLAATSFKGRFVGFKKWGYNLTHWAKEDKFFWSYKRPKPPN